ncbi:BadF/BadG/BcrA/BcrD ATPase family protein [Amaricoccus solimangrovi]|uniref:ATPase n=1 Tax=Amaricoccus solimangrovi TaxID=2589815 RepID=A0A501X0A9_9RHOB|nr:BadF/BadG/BcrA/BcrD ATPase family protein [Amaricoccus solimangrovi]TPE52991.1 ATPase [Amaricoccus solimangrovi]
MELFLGVDGGGTNCRAAIADQGGMVLGLGEAGSANIMTDPEVSRRNILAAAEAALRATGLGAGFGDLAAVLGLAGANVAAAARRMERDLPFARVRLESDVTIAVKGALGAEDGIVAVLGTGSIFAAQREGMVRKVGGWGFRLSDLGGGARLGQAILEAALLAHDGLRPRSGLLDALVVEAKGPEGLVTFAHGATPRDFAALVPRIFAAAALGDAAAIDVIAKARGDIVAAIDLLSAEEPLPICFVGGVGRLFEEQLARRYSERIRAPKGSALDGALAMARGVA